jgi:hypothetical protein
MRTALDANPSQLDEHEDRFVSLIRKHGWIRTSVFEDTTGPGFSYTTGFWLSLNFPEVVIFSLKAEVAHDTFWQLFREIKNGKRFKVREPTEDIFANVKAVLLPVSEHKFEDYFGWSRWFYGGDTFQCLQLVWPDRNGNFPWQGDFSTEMSSAQTDLTDGGWSGLAPQ